MEKKKDIKGNTNTSPPSPGCHKIKESLQKNGEEEDRQDDVRQQEEHKYFDQGEERSILDVIPQF